MDGPGLAHEIGVEHVVPLATSRGSDFAGLAAEPSGDYVFTNGGGLPI